MNKLYILGAVIAIAIAGFTWFVHVPQPSLPEPQIISYDNARYPGISCIADRVIVESAAWLDSASRDVLWHEYGLTIAFEWVAPEHDFTYHELDVVPHTWFARIEHAITQRALPARELPALVAMLNEDPRINWAAPDALALEWCDEIRVPPGEELILDTPVTLSAPIATSTSSSTGGNYGVSFIDPYFRPLSGGLTTWETTEGVPDPLPDFEYYRLCAPGGTAVAWAAELADSDAFTARCKHTYGTNQALSLQKYMDAGSPQLSPVTILVADTGVHVNHPDYAQRLHPNSIDANYRNYQIASAEMRPTARDTITDRYGNNAIGLPRQAVHGRPASHGTAVTGILARCTTGFGKDGDAIRLLPASIKSARTVTLSGYKIKSPISAFIKLIACLNTDFPVGQFTPGESEHVQNTGDVRVVSISASVPRTYFSDAEWKVVSPLIGKVAGSISEDLSTNDRVYVFAAGNDAQPEPNRPCQMDYVIGVCATAAYDGSKPWYRGLTGEGSNMGAKCISAPGYGMITSTIAPHPNLSYLPPEEFWPAYDNYSTPLRTQRWEWQRNSFGASSGATPQVSALAALLYAQQPGRDYHAVQSIIYDSVGERQLIADWGEARGIIDYDMALAPGW